MPAILPQPPLQGWWVGAVGSHKVAGVLIQKLLNSQMASIKVLIWGPHVTKCSYIIQSHQLVLWWFLVGCLRSQARWSLLKTTQAPMDVGQAWEWGIGKSRLLYFWYVIIQTWTVSLLLCLSNGGEKWDLLFETVCM